MCFRLRLPAAGLRRQPLLLALLVATAPLLTAEPPYALPRSEVHSLPRAANGRDYLLYVGLPASYASSPTRRYPVVYGCDGYWDFQLLTAETRNLATDGAAPECIVVSFSYAGANPDYGSLRGWDLTPGVDLSYGGSSGHAQEFLAVVADQFIPYVETHFRVDSSFRVLTGASFGGLFTTYALFERPELFQAFIAVSPSLGWRNRELLSREQEFARTHRELPVRVFLTYAGAESDWIKIPTRQLARQLRGSAYAGLSVAIREIEGERHSGTGPDAYNRGLRFAFAPRAPVPPTVTGTGLGSRSPLINISSRARVGRGEDVLIAGFVIDGPEPKRVLVRAVGPGLAAHGVAAVLADPVLTLYDNTQRPVAQNDNWGDAATDPAAAGRQVGAFPLPAGSRDAALLLTVEPGLYSAVVTSADGGEGVAMVEVYEVLP